MMLQRWRATACWLFGVLLLASCSKGPQPGAVLDEAKQAGRDGTSFKHSADDYFHDMDGAVELDPAEIAGRNMWLVWSGGNDRFWDEHERLHLRRLRPAEGRQLASQSLGYDARIALELLRPGQRAVLRERDRRRPEPARPLARRALARTAPPIRSRTRASIPGVAIGSRGKPLGDGTTQPVGSFYGYATRHRRPAPVPEPGVRREGGQGLGRRALLHRSELLQPQGPGAAVPRRHVVRLLPRRPEPGESARRSGASRVREPQLVGRRAVHVGRSPLHLQLEQARGPQELHVPARPHVSARAAWTPRWSRPTASTTRAR